jgi:GntR family transcriptional regulator, transcriptional repressor for pyruvate dehydrogenase complex
VDERAGRMTGSEPQASKVRVRPPILADKIYQQIAARIASGEFRVNAKLPSEHELSRMLKVSRPILRSALERLREEGIVASRQGAGTFVRDRSTAALAFSPVETIADIQRCYEFRLSIEPFAAHSAAMRRGPESLKKLEHALELLRDATRISRHREDADFNFHLGVAEAANNHYFSSTLLALRQHIYSVMHMHGMSLMGPGPKLGNVLDEHNAIYEAVRDGKGDQAERLMRLHLEGSRDRLFEGRMLDLRIVT